MAEKTRNLCAEIPLELHTKVRQRQAESGRNTEPVHDRAYYQIL